MHPKWVVIDAQFQSFCFTHRHQLGQRDVGIFGHIGMIGAKVALHGHETIGAHHVVAIGEQVGCHPVDVLLPYLFGHILFAVSHFGHASIFINCPIEWCFLGRELFGFEFSRLVIGVFGDVVGCPSAVKITAIDGIVAATHG